MKYPALRTKLREQLTTGSILIAPGAYDAFSARAVERAGFDAVHAGSYSIAGALGLPDVGMLDLTELAAKVADICAAVSIPVIADAENGFYSAAAMQRVVSAYERSGASAIHIEDHVSGKHTSLEKRVLPLEQAVDRICAAVDARDDPAFMVIARTDVTWATGNVQDSLVRAAAFLAAGADAVMPVGLSLAQLGEIRGGIKGPVVIVNNGRDAVDAEAAAGANVVIYHSLCLDAAARAVPDALKQLRASLDIGAVRACLAEHEEVDSFLGYEQYDIRLKRYRVQ
jgi:methylisocitrate lyase